MQSAEEKIQVMREKRDAKVREHLIQYAPLWLVEEVPLPAEDAIQFEAIFYHPRYHWTKRRYRYDSYNNVLYHKGQITVAEEDTYELQATEPYLAAPALNTVNSYGG
jgi:hypothetical protein